MFIKKKLLARNYKLMFMQNSEVMSNKFQLPIYEHALKSTVFTKIK